MSVIVSSRNSTTLNYHSSTVRRKRSGRNQEKRGKGAPAEAEAPDAPGAGDEEDVRRAFGEEGGEEGAVEQEQDSPEDAEGHVADADGERGARRQKHGIDADKVKTFRDDRLPFTEEQVKTETARCLSCGAALVDQNICIGCGLCTTRCKFDSIQLHRKYDAWGVPYEKLVGHVLATTAQKAGRSLLKKEI